MAAIEPVVGGSPEQLASRRQQLRQQTVEQHRLLRRLADEQSQIEAELEALERDEQALLGEAPSARAVARLREQRARAQARLATVAEQAARTREQRARVLSEAAGVLEAVTRDEAEGAAPEPLPDDLHARRAMQRTNDVVEREISADMRVFLGARPAATVEEWAAQSSWARDTGGARDEHGLSLRVRDGTWKRLFEEAKREPLAEPEPEPEPEPSAVLGRRYRCLSRAAATADLDADAADPSLSFNLIETGTIIRCDESGVSMDGRHRLRCDQGWVSLVAMDGQQLLEPLEEDQEEPRPTFGLALKKMLKKADDNLRSIKVPGAEDTAESRTPREPGPEPEPPPIVAAIGSSIESGAAEAKVVLSEMGGSLMRMLGNTPAPPVQSSREMLGDWRHRLPAVGRTQRLPTVPPSPAEPTTNMVALYRCVGTEPLTCRAADDAGSSELPALAAGSAPPLPPALRLAPIGAGSVCWPGQVVKGRLRAESHVVGPGGLVSKRQRCLEVEGSGGCWLPVLERAAVAEEAPGVSVPSIAAPEIAGDKADAAAAPDDKASAEDDQEREHGEAQGEQEGQEADEGEEDRVLLRSLELETEAEIFRPRSGRDRHPVGVREVVFRGDGPLGLHFGKGSRDREKQGPALLTVTGFEPGGYAETLGGVDSGDILIAVDGVSVLGSTTIAQLQAAVVAAGRPIVLSFRTPLPRGASADGLAQHAECLRREARLISAAAGYSMALAAGHRQAGWCLNQHGTCLGEAGLWAEAVRSFDKAIELEPGPKAAPRQFNRAYLLRRMGDLEAAAAGFRTAMALDAREAERCATAIAEIEAQ